MELLEWEQSAKTFKTHPHKAYQSASTVARRGEPSMDASHLSPVMQCLHSKPVYTQCSMEARTAATHGLNNMDFCSQRLT